MFVSVVGLFAPKNAIVLAVGVVVKLPVFWANAPSYIYRAPELKVRVVVCTLPVLPVELMPSSEPIRRVAPLLAVNVPVPDKTLVPNASVAPLFTVVTDAPVVLPIKLPNRVLILPELRV